MYSILSITTNEGFKCFHFHNCQVYGDKDLDGFYRGEVKGRMGLIPCNMVSEIRADDDETMDHLIKQGFLPLSTPVDKIGTGTPQKPEPLQ